METKELLEGIKEQILLIEEEIDKTTAAAKGRCRSAASEASAFSTASSGELATGGGHRYTVGGRRAGRYCRCPTRNCPP